MPREKTEELAVMPEAPVLPIVPEETAEQPVTEECLPETAANPVVEDTVPTEGVLDEPAEVVTVPEDPQHSEKPKRTVRKRTAAKKTIEVEKQATPPTEDAAASAEPAPAAVHQRDILTLDARGEAETQAQMEDIIWHEIHNAYRTRRMLSGMLSGIERTEAGKTIAIVDYKGFRIVIPLKEMVLDFPADMYGADYNEMILRHQKILNKMLGAEVDLMVKGIDAKSRTVVASRKDAMLKKQQIYYFGKDSDGQYRIYDGRVVEARVIAVAEQVVRVEVFGVETSILARDLSWDWIGDAHDRYAVGDKTLVRVLEIDRTEPEHIRIKADIKSVSGNSKNDNLQKCRIQGKYAGKVTHIHKGVVYIRLSNGANAIAHSCYDRRRPGRKDDVSFAVTHLDEEHGVALGIITRIIKQHV